MTKGASDEFAARCHALCPGFVATGPIVRARKSELLAGTLDDAPVLAKRLHRSSPVWSWYQARELAVYRAFAAHPSPVRAPRLIAASDELLVIERIVGEPLATKRRAYVELEPAMLEQLLASLDALAAWQGAVAEVPAAPRVRARLREGLIEDPASGGQWIRDGILRSGRRGLVSARAARRVSEAIDLTQLAFGHGDLLVRNVIASGGEPVLVDWECAGSYPRDWDRALLSTQLAESAGAALEAPLRHDTRRIATFRALVAFALVRELRFLRAFGVAAHTPAARRCRDEIDRALERLE
jgi:aminoglycoside phosphotransferase (APT) family kinase protein